MLMVSETRTWRRLPQRKCHFCNLPIPGAEKAVRAKTNNAWAHFECWYDGSLFDRDVRTGEQLR
jgi:hypothetical protein